MAKAKTATKAPAASPVTKAAEFKALRAKAKDTAVQGWQSMDAAALTKATDDSLLVTIHSPVIRAGYWNGAKFDSNGNARIIRGALSTFVGQKSCSVVG